MDTLKVTIDKENNTISIYNNGRGIPIEIHQKEKIYVPELIFGHLLTSSNYDDNEKKVVGGRNGYGAKLCNIFSKEFTVETTDRNTAKKFKQVCCNFLACFLKFHWQVFRNNMSERSEPKITSTSGKDEYTKITFKPDLEKFGMIGIDDDIEALMKKRVYDLCATVKDIKVFLNDERLKIRNFRQYIDLYTSGKNELLMSGKPPPVIHEVVNDRWEIAFTLSEGQFQQVSYYFYHNLCNVYRAI
jgi:DNA topoisomerase-2